MPIAATASAPCSEVRLFSSVMPVTFSRFCIDAGTPTAHTPSTMNFCSETRLGSMHTYVSFLLSTIRTRK